MIIYIENVWGYEYKVSRQELVGSTKLPTWAKASDTVDDYLPFNKGLITIVKEVQQRLIFLPTHPKLVVGGYHNISDLLGEVSGFYGLFSG